MVRFKIVYDNYCGWCYGAHPIFSALTKGRADVSVYHRLLFSGQNAPRMADGFGRMALAYDKRIGQLTGQEFSQAYVENVLMSPTEVLSSDVTAQAAALVRDQGATVELELANRLQRARYVDGTTAADRTHVIEALVDAGIGRDIAEDKLGSPALLAEAERTAHKAERLMTAAGASGVPLLIFETDGVQRVVDLSAFYQRPETILQLAA